MSDENTRDCPATWGHEDAGHAWIEVSQSTSGTPPYRRCSKCGTTAPIEAPRELLREARMAVQKYVEQGPGDPKKPHELLAFALARIDTALAPTTQGTDSGLAVLEEAAAKLQQRAEEYRKRDDEDARKYANEASRCAAIVRALAEGGSQ